MFGLCASTRPVHPGGALSLWAQSSVTTSGETCVDCRGGAIGWVLRLQVVSGLSLTAGDRPSVRWRLSLLLVLEAADPLLASLWEGAGAEPSPQIPEEAGVRAVLETLEDVFGLLLAEAPVLDSRVDGCRHMPATDTPGCVVEVARLGCCA